MAGLIRYLLLANFFLIIMALSYHLILSRETRFKTNRFILIIGTLLSLVLPLFHFSWLPAGSYTILTIPEIIISAKSSIAHFDIDEIQIFGTAPYIFPWIKFLSISYLTGILTMCILLIWRIKKIQFWTQSYPMKWVQNLYVTLIPNEWSPFSFLGVVYHPLPFDKMDKKTKMILEHEKVHVRQKHSWDVLFIELVKLFFFYNPAIFTIKKQIQINHEYIVDSHVVGDEPRIYSQELIRSQFQVPQFQFIQQFNQTSFLKKRILMLTKNKKNSFGLIKYLLMVPVIGGLLWISACTDEADPEIHQNQMVIPGSTSELNNSKSTIKIYAETIISSDYAEMNTLEKQAKDMAVKMKKNGAGEEKVLSYLEIRISSWAIENIEAIESSLLFKAANLNIKDIEIDPVDIETEEEGEVFLIVEEMPEFEGEGLNRFQKWVQQNVKYPEIAIQNGIKGTVFVNFIIDQNGDISSIKILRGVDPSLDNEVIRVLESAPSWAPGKQRGENVKVRMSIPVKFMLE